MHAPSDFWKFRVVLNQGDSSFRQLFKGGNYSKHKLFYIVRQLFKGGNYSREETINYYDFLSATTIQGRQLFKRGNYSRKYGI